MRICDISEFLNKCTGCMACADICPTKCIHSYEESDGFIYAKIDETKCIQCGKCYFVCPAEHSEKNTDTQSLFAAYSIEKDIQKNGSSGGIFELLAENCIKMNYYICGAAFNKTVLSHRIIKEQYELSPLLKSKYVQSNMEGIYDNIRTLLKNGERVFYCGTPCQVSALINFLSVELCKNLFTADIICHGVPSQKLFDKYIRQLENKNKGSINEFVFRVKDNKYKHAHGYAYKVSRKGKYKIVNGIYTDSSFYNAFKNYLIFRNSCYNCKYATLSRVSDITLGDFWGIEKYDFNGNTDNGVSMVITNTKKGRDFFDKIKDSIIYKEFPVEYGIKSNYCLTNTTPKPENRDEIIESLSNESYDIVAKKYFKGSLKYRLYWLIPPYMRNWLRKIRRS